MCSRPVSRRLVLAAVPPVNNTGHLNVADDERRDTGRLAPSGTLGTHIVVAGRRASPAGQTTLLRSSLTPPPIQHLRQASAERRDGRLKRPCRLETVGVLRHRPPTSTVVRHPRAAAAVRPEPAGSIEDSASLSALLDQSLVKKRTSRCPVPPRDWHGVWGVRLTPSGTPWSSRRRSQSPTAAAC